MPIRKKIAYDPNLKLWYDKPATVWEEALPLGNAKTGAMVFGGVTKEKFQLNDNTLWSGYPNPGNNAEGPKILPLIRQQVFEGNYDSAANLWRKMHGPYSARYLPLADLWLMNSYSDSIASSYYRDLDLNTAVSTVRYTINKITYQRETFISHPGKVMVIRITANKKGTISFSTSLTSKLKYQSGNVANDYLVLKGKAPKFVANRESEKQQVVYDDWTGEGMNFEVHVKLVAEGGLTKQLNDQLIVTNANAVTLYLTEATSFNGFNKSPGLQGKDPSVEAKENLKKAASKSFAQLKKEHISDYQSLFHRVSLDLGKDPSLMNLPTDQRLRAFVKGPGDNHLAMLYYQYGRYLMIASS